MKIPTQILHEWEKRFPDLFGKWTHWKIVGDEYCIAVIEGTQLIEALKIIEENYGKYSSIWTWRATVDENGNLQEEDDKKPYEISNYRYDEQNRKKYESLRFRGRCFLRCIKKLEMRAELENRDA